MKSHAVAESTSATTAKRSAPAVRSTRAGALQTKLAVNSPGDAYEHEADRAADAAVRASADRPARPIALDVTPLAQRAPAEPRKDDEKPVQKKEADVTSLAQRAQDEPKKDEEKPVQKKEADAAGPLAQRLHTEPHRKDADDDEKRAQMKTADPATEKALETQGVPERVEAQIAAMSSGGESLPRAERAFFEGRFGYDFGEVRVHAGTAAARTAAALNARAFTVGQNIFFGSGEYRPGSVAGRQLVAHELTHTIQQAPPAARAARMVQRGWLSDAEDWVLGKIDDFALEIPGYKLLTGLLGTDPITDTPVNMTGEELIHEGLVEFVPDGEAIFQKLQADKTITQFLDYLHQQWAQLNLSWQTIKTIFKQAWDDLGISDLTDPGGAWEKIKSHFVPPLERLKTFIVNVGGYILDVIKQKVLEWLRDWATKIPGYPLLTFILGKDPFTDEPVPRTPTTFVKAVLSLVPGGDKIFENLQKSHTIERTVDWLNQEIIKLDLSWEKIKALFAKAWDVISIADLLHPIEFIDKIRDIFEAPAIRVVNFALAVGKKVLEFIFEGVMILAGPLGQRVVAIFQKASAAFSKIIADPVAFLGHLLDAVALGFKQFVAKIGEYLEAGVIAWLTGSLQNAGITLPKVWDLQGILSLVLQILGITYAKMRAKVVKALGDNGEKIVSTAERLWGFLVTLVNEGPAAAWKQISEALGNLWNLVIGGIKDWAVVKIIKVAVAQLAMMFNPVGAVIEAIIETYRTIEFFVKRFNQILDLVEAIVDSIANIAAGQIGAAANYVEKTLARTIPVIIGFLASLVGLDDVSEGIRDTITALQQKVDEAIDVAIAWIVEQIKALFGKEEEDKEDKKHDPKWAAGVAGVKADVEKMEEVTAESLEAAVPGWKETYGFTELKIVMNSEEGTWEIDGAMSPEDTVAKGTLNEPAELKPFAVGTAYEFSEVDPSAKTNPRRGILSKKQQINNEWWFFYHSADDSSTNWGARAFKPDKKTVGATPDTGPGATKTRYTTDPGHGGTDIASKPVRVKAIPLVKTPYSQPVNPYGFERLVSGARVRGHIVNGEAGGESDYRNMLPITASNNSEMSSKHEQVIRAGLKLGFYYSIDASVDYWSPGTPAPYKFPEDFPETLSVNYSQAFKDPSGGSWTESNTLNESYDIPLPTLAEIRPNKVEG